MKTSLHKKVSALHSVYSAHMLAVNLQNLVCKYYESTNLFPYLQEEEIEGSQSVYSTEQWEFESLYWTGQWELESGLCELESGQWELESGQWTGQ